MPDCLDSHHPPGGGGTDDPFTLPPERGLEIQRVHTDVAVDELLPSDAWRRDGTEDIRHAHPERKQCPVGARGSVEFNGNR